MNILSTISSLLGLLHPLDAKKGVHTGASDIAKTVSGTVDSLLNLVAMLSPATAPFIHEVQGIVDNILLTMSDDEIHAIMAIINRFMHGTVDTVLPTKG